MLEAIKHFYSDHISPTSATSQASPQRRLQLATAALLLEVAQADNERHSVEFQAIHEGIREVFNLTDEDTIALIELADHEAHEATDRFEFTNLVDEQYDYAEKCQVVELLWRVCLSDAEMDRYEERLVRKIANLLHVEHKDFIAAKLRVQRRYSRGYYRDFDHYE